MYMMVPPFTEVLAAESWFVFVPVQSDRDTLQCFDTVGWATGRASGR